MYREQQVSHLYDKLIEGSQLPYIEYADSVYVEHAVTISKFKVQNQCSNK